MLREVGDVDAAIRELRRARRLARRSGSADGPLFSALRMDDGPLTAYDLERLTRAPQRIVLSSCDSGRGATAGADELLGLVSALIPLGTAGLVASVVPVNDAAAVPLMAGLHQRVRGAPAWPRRCVTPVRILSGSRPSRRAAGHSSRSVRGERVGASDPGNRQQQVAPSGQGLGRTSRPGWSLPPV